MTVREYWSGDASAPSLTGAVGSLVALLDAILVNGYGSQTAAGWTKTFTATNKANFKNAGTGAVLYVDDSAPTTAKEARVTGFKTDSAIGAGTGQFPTAVQSTIGIGAVVIRKSTTADATVRGWRCLADSTFFYLFTETGDYTSPTVAFSFGFGDFTAQGASDTSNAFIMGRQSENTTVASTNTQLITEPFPNLVAVSASAMSTTTLGCYTMAKGDNQGGSLPFGKHSDQMKMGWTGGGSGMIMGYLGDYRTGGANATWFTNFSCPNPFDMATYTAKVWIHQQGALRGYFKNLHCPLQHLPFSHGDLIAGTGAFSGKNFRVINLLGPIDFNSPTAGWRGQCFLEI